MPYSQDKKKKRDTGTATTITDQRTGGTRRRHRSSATADKSDSKINKGLAGLAARTRKPTSEAQAEAVESTKPKGGGEQKDVDDPAPRRPVGPASKPNRKSFPSGLAGDAAYQKALRNWNKKRKQ